MGSLDKTMTDKLVHNLNENRLELLVEKFGRISEQFNKNSIKYPKFLNKITWLLKYL